MAELEHPPTRYSIHDQDFDLSVGERLIISVDGVKQNLVIEYDCDTGTVLKHIADSEGHPRSNPLNTDTLKETIQGQVTVEWRDQAGGSSKL